MNTSPSQHPLLLPSTTDHFYSRTDNVQPLVNTDSARRHRLCERVYEDECPGRCMITQFERDVAPSVTMIPMASPKHATTVTTTSILQQPQSREVEKKSDRWLPQGNEEGTEENHPGVDQCQQFGTRHDHHELSDDEQEESVDVRSASSAPSINQHYQIRPPKPHGYSESISSLETSLDDNDDYARTLGGPTSRSSFGNGNNSTGHERKYGDKGLFVIGSRWDSEFHHSLQLPTGVRPSLPTCTPSTPTTRMTENFPTMILHQHMRREVHQGLPTLVASSPPSAGGELKCFRCKSFESLTDHDVVTPTAMNTRRRASYDRIPIPPLRQWLVGEGANTGEV